MTKFTEQDLLNSVKSLNESLNIVEGEHIGDAAELQRLFAQSNGPQPRPTYAVPNTPQNKRPATLANIPKIKSAFDSTAPHQSAPSVAQPQAPAAPHNEKPLQPPSDAQLQKLLAQSKEPVDMGDISKQSTSDNFARPFYSPEANKRDRIITHPEDSFYNPDYSNQHFDQDFTPNQPEVDQATKLRQRLQGQQNPWEVIRTPNGPRKITLTPNDQIAENIDRILQIAKWQG